MHASSAGGRSWRCPGSRETGAAESGATSETRNHEDAKTRGTRQVFFVLSRLGNRPLHHFKAVHESGFSVSRWRNSAITMASPTAASAAATVMTKKTMI